MTFPRRVSNFTPIDSVYGPFIINRHCAFQAEALIKTGVPHIQSELNQLLQIAATMPDGAVAVDAGANAGLVTVPLARLLAAKGGFLHAFEVQRMMYYALCGTIALNDLANVHVHHAALGAAPGSIAVNPPDYATPQDFGSFSLLDKSDSAAGTSETVAMTTIDNLALPRLDFLKIDVEGMEIDVLKGAAETIRAYQPWCWIEYWKVDMDAIEQQFAGMDYGFFKMDQLNVVAAPAKRVAESGFNFVKKTA